MNLLNFPFGDFFSCSGMSFRLTLRIWKNLSAVSVELTGAETRGSVLPIFLRRPLHTPKGELPLPPIQSHQTTSHCSCIVGRFRADSVMCPIFLAAFV